VTKRTLVLLSAFVGLGCPGTPKTIAYDLAERAAVADRSCSGDVVLFGTPAAEPQLAEGFYRELATSGDGYVWSKAEAELVLRWSPAPRVAVLDLAPYHGVQDQAVRVLLNGAPVGSFRLNDARHRYRLTLPAERQRPGENRLRFEFDKTASPADLEPGNQDRRRLAAAFYSLAVAPKADAALDDLLRREAPRPFAVGDDGGVPSLTLLGPSSLRYALRVPEAAELRFRPRVHRAARGSATDIPFRVTLEARPGEERELWSRVLRGGDDDPAEVSVLLPGRPGDVVRLGLHVGGGPDARFQWGDFVGPRVLGRGAAAPPGTAIPRTDRRGDDLRRSLAGSNVVLIILDAARADHFGCYGYGRRTTPEIDAIAADGVVFESAFTPAVYTLGAMSSLWTSQYPDRHHSEVSFSAQLPKDRLTLAQLLTAQGIKTAGFVANAVAGPRFGFDRGFEEFHEVYRTLGSRGDVFRKALPPWLEANRGRRFFAYVHFREPHFPYDPEPPFDTLFGPDGPIGKAARRDMPFFTDINQGRRRASAGEIEHLVRLYDGSLAFADQEVGALRRNLEALGLWDRTVVIIAADHGEALHEHGWIGHNVQLFEESVRIPLVVRFPTGKGPRGVRVKGLVELLDLAPTIADVLGVLGEGGSAREFQGRSLLPVLAGAPARSAVLLRTVWDTPRYALRDESFKYFYDTRTGEERLVDLRADPQETGDVQGREALRTAYYRQELHHRVRRLSRPAEAAPAPSTMTPEQCANLKALGYLAADYRCPDG
jgi:arylsulfatase A-like enzyme